MGARLWSVWNVGLLLATRDNMDQEEPETTPQVPPPIEIEKQDEPLSPHEKTPSPSNSPVSSPPPIEIEKQDEPLSPHEKTPSPSNSPVSPTPPIPDIPVRPPPQRPQSQFNPGSAATLPLPENKQRPLSASVNPSGDEIYDRLPLTLPRQPRNVTQTQEVPLKPLVIKEEPHIEETGQEKSFPKENTIEKEIPAESPYDDINTHKILTIVSMVLCSLILNVFAFACLIPAYIFSTKSRESLQAGDFGKAEKLAKTSLILNLVTVIFTFFVVLGIFIIIIIALGASGGF